jgi:transposase
MLITRCKLSKKTQLLEFLVLEVTARSAANLLDIQANTATLFYHKTRHIIAHNLNLYAEEMFG